MACRTEKSEVQNPLVRLDEGGIASSAAPRRWSLLYIKKLIAIVVAFIAAVQLMADTQSDWYASLSKKREATYVSIGGEQWRADDKDKPLPYRFPCGAVLHSTLGGKRLDLNNVAIAKGGIYADGEFAILLAGNNYILEGINIVHVDSYYPLLIFGTGSLIVRGGYPGAISSSELAICAGASVTVHDTSEAWTPLSGRKLLVNASSLAVFAPGTNGTSFNSIDILGAVVTIFAKNNGLYAFEGNVVIDGSVVNVLSQNYEAIDTKTLVCQHSYLSCVSYSHYGILTDESHFDNSLVKVYSRSGAAINTDKVVFGEGDYYVVCGHPPMPLWSADLTRAVWANDMIINGGNVQTCSVGTHDDSCAVDADHFKIDAGRLEIVDKVDVRDFLKYDAAAATAFTGALASGMDVTSLMANFYSQVILDAISNGKIGDATGVTDIGMRCGTYTQDCGTVWCDLSKYGAVLSYQPEINGGVFKGWFKYYWNDDAISPLNSAGNALKCVSYAVAGAKKYDKIMQSWPGILPLYYGTGSLYADSSGKLYFWVPESWDVPGGSSGGGGGSGGGGDDGGGSGGGSGGGGSGGGGSGGGTTADVDLEPYTPSGWSAPLAFSTGYYSGSAESDTFRTANTVYAKIAFNNGLSTTISPTFHAAVYVDGTLKYSTDINGLKSGHYYYVTGINLGSFAEGTHTVKMVVDSGGAIPESDESNNTYTRTFTVSNPAQYTIFFNRNAKPNDREESWDHVGIDEDYTLPTMEALKWYRDGDTFLGWATSETAKVAQYVAGQIVRNLGAKGSYVNLYGVWKNRVSSACTITFNANGGSVTETTRSLAYGSTLGSLPSPVRQGYSFDGWYTSVDGYGRVNSSTIVTGSATYYAHWTKIEGFYLSGAYVADKSRTFMGAAYYYYNPAGVISLKIGKANKKGVFKVSGSLTTTDGKKHKLKATAATQNGGFVTVKNIQVKGLGTLTVNLAGNGFTGSLSNGWTARTANVSSLEKGRYKFDVNPYPTSIKGIAVLTEYLPRGLVATSNGIRIDFPKAGRVAYKKGVLAVGNGENNPSGLKLKFAPRTGLVTGSFAVYTFDRKRLKKWTAKVTGICVEGDARMSVKISGITFNTNIVATMKKE